MKESEYNITGQIVVLCLLLLFGYFIPPEWNKSPENWYNAALGIFVALLVQGVGWVIKNNNVIKFWIKTNISTERSQPIRITISYLFKIELDGKYLLVRNKKKINGYQPVGGVYKYFRDEMSIFFNEVGLIPCTEIERNIADENDLRMHLKNRYNLSKVIGWFAKRENREVDPWREFYEELINTNLLSHTTFPHIQYRFIRQHAELKYSEFHKILEYKVADIYELKFTNEDQKKAIRKLMESKNDEILVVTTEDIKKEKKEDKQILEHTYKII